VIRIDADHRLRGVCPGGLRVARAHVHRDRSKLSGALPGPWRHVLGAVRSLCRRGWLLLDLNGFWLGRVSEQFGIELGEELIGGLLAGALGAPHHLPVVMIDDEREVPVLFSPADVVHSDVVEVVQAGGIKLIGADAADDPPDGAPVDPEHPLDRCLVRPGREPRDEAFEVARELRARAGERDALGTCPVLGAPQPPPAAVDLQPPENDALNWPHCDVLNWPRLDV
jgi:hypothetical protein